MRRLRKYLTRALSVALAAVMVLALMGPLSARAARSQVLITVSVYNISTGKIAEGGAITAYRNGSWIYNGVGSAEQFVVDIGDVLRLDTYGFYGRKFRGWHETSPTSGPTLSLDGRIEITAEKSMTLFAVYEEDYECPPSIRDQPQDLLVARNMEANFSVVAESRGNLKYQWQYRRSGNTSWSNFLSESAKSFDLRFKATAAHNGFKVRCIVTDESNGKKDISDEATLTVLENGRCIDARVYDRTEAWEYQGGAYMVATGDGIVYTGGGTSHAFEVGTKITMLAYPATGYRYVGWYEGTPDIGKKLTSAQEYPITVSEGIMIYAAFESEDAPKITKHPADTAAAVGSTAKFTVAASGTGTVQYQWQAYNPKTKQWVNSGAASAKTATLSVSVQLAHQGYRFRCVVVDSKGVPTVSDAAKLSVKPYISAQPKKATVSVGETAEFSVTATGLQKLTYQWQAYNPNTKKWTNSSAPGAQTEKLSLTAQAAHHEFQFRCIVTDAEGNKTTSSAAKLTVKPAITTQPKSTTVSVGGTAKFTVTAKGKETLKYQWQTYNTSTSKWVNCSAPSAKTATFTFTAQKGHNGKKFRCLVMDGNGKMNISNNAVLTVK